MMSYIEYVDLEDTATFPFGNNDPADGSASDADSAPAFDVRLVGAAASAAPTFSGTCTLLSNAGYEAGNYEVSIACTAANGFAADSTYFVYISSTTGSVASTAAVGVIKTGGNLLSAKDVGMVYKSTIDTVDSQTQFQCAKVISTNDILIGASVSIEDVSNGDISVRWVTDVQLTNDIVVINAAPDFTVAASDIIRIKDQIHPSYALTLYDPPTRTEAAADRDTITSKLLSYFRIALRSDAAIATDQATEVTAINNDEGAGAGDYLNTADSLEAQADVSTSARLAKLDSLTFTTAGNVDANIVKVAAGGDIVAAGTGGQEYGET